MKNLNEPVELRLGDERIHVRTSSKETGGRFTAVEVVAAPRSGPPLHVHHHEDEWFHVLEGDFIFEIAGVMTHAGPGTSLLGPRDIPHAFQNAGDTPGKLLVVAIPGGLDLFFTDMDATFPPGTEITPETYAPVGQKHGMELLGPPLAVRLAAGSSARQAAQEVLNV